MKLGTKLILSLVSVVLGIMAIHGYLSIQQEQESIDRELRVGMRGFTRVVHANLRRTYGEEQDLVAMQDFIDIAAPRGNVHAVIVYDQEGNVISRSESIRYGSDFPE
ncbi:MAG: hypothetical protein OEN50_19865, partial [Deltaproteobacteria bacterium]|nr:hypothetical protein [Deltaproteobacteria bacterium]